MNQSIFVMPCDSLYWQQKEAIEQKNHIFILWLYSNGPMIRNHLFHPPNSQKFEKQKGRSEQASADEIQFATELLCALCNVQNISIHIHVCVCKACDLLRFLVWNRVTGCVSFCFLVMWKCYARRENRRFNKDINIEADIFSTYEAKKANIRVGGWETTFSAFYCHILRANTSN